MKPTQHQISAFKYVIETAMKTLSITREQAEARVWIIIESGLLEQGTPEDKYFQMMIENFMRFDPSKLDYKKMFAESMNFPALVKEYDKKFGRSLTAVLNDLKTKGIMPFEKVKFEIQQFDNFFFDNIWSKYPKRD